MSIIKNFKQRKLAEKAKAIASKAPKADTQEVNEALTLLAKLLNVGEELAIAEARKYVEANIDFFDVGVDLASGEDVAAKLEVTQDEKGNITHVDGQELKAAIEESAADLTEQANALTDAITDAANNAASTVERSAEQVSDSTDGLAYATDDIASATTELKEATAELKKPSAVQKSSNSKTKKSPKNS